MLNSILFHTAEPELSETIIFLSYILTCTALFKRRFSLRTTLLAFGAAAVVIGGVQAALVLSGEKMLALTLLPLTAYLPFSILMYFLSDCGVFETAAVCSVGMLDVLILKSLRKIVGDLISLHEQGMGVPLYIMSNAVVALAAAGLVFIAFKYIGKAFRFCIIENRQNRLLLSVPTVMVFLMFFYFLNSTTDIIVLIFTMLIALSVFLIIAKLLNSTSELMRMRRLEKEMSEHMEIQRRGYDKLMRKMEADRVYRHDIRHHLTIIEGLAKQGDCEKVIEYTGRMNGSLTALENVGYCKNPEINAVLSEYISRAEKAGCRVTQNIALTEKLPFAEDDVCIVLANSVENAINACTELPEERRYISISAECTDNRRLFISVKNPCSDTVRFDENELPVVEGGTEKNTEKNTEEHTEKHTEEHGIGLHSMNLIAEKYNGFLRCKLENGEFVLHVAMFCEEDIPKRKETSRGSVSKRAVSSLLGFGLGTIIVLNIVPSAAEAASSLLSVNIRTVRSLFLGWGDSSVSMEYPDFEGNGAEELNNAVTNYVNEAREKFLWYFNRKYNGYVAEDMRYTVIRDDERYFIVQFTVTVNAGGSMNYSRWIVFDKNADKVLKLGDLFKEGSDYIGVLSAEILRQMKEKNEMGIGQFYVDGRNAFTEISEDADFYIDSFDRIVIVFEEYEVAAGEMGVPVFYINNSVWEEIAES